ncbi:MAG: hypothetical protein V4569_20320 [Pseudomonadota bacterium]
MQRLPAQTAPTDGVPVSAEQIAHHDRRRRQRRRAANLNNDRYWNFHPCPQRSVNAELRSDL